MGASVSRVLIVDDLRLVRDALSAVVDGEGDLVVCAAVPGGEGVLGVIRRHMPDLVLMNLGCANACGHLLMKRIAGEFSGLPLLAYALNDHDLFHAELAWQAGATGYVTRTDAVKTVIMAVRALLRGEIHLAPHLRARLLKHAVGKPDLLRGDPVRALSAREAAVFHLTARGYSTKAIAARLSLSRKTVETYRERIRSKLRLKNGSELLQYAILHEHGYAHRQMTGPS